MRSKSPRGAPTHPDPGPPGTMADHGGKKAGKKNRFKFGKKKENNGVIPGHDPEASVPDIVGGGNVDATSRKIPENGGYTLRNSDIINGRSGHHSDNHGDHGNHADPAPVCTCPHDADNSSQNNGNLPRSASTESSQLSVVAVIEGQPPPVPTSPPPDDSHNNNNNTGVSSGSSTSSASIVSVRPKGPDAHTLLHGGSKSPSSQSLVSVASSTVAMDTPGDHAFSRVGSDRPKQTLGDIIAQIDHKTKSLLATEDFSSSAPFPDLQFLAHQSRYNSDIHIKRRLIAKLVDSHICDIFLRVYRSVQSLDYLAEVDGANRPRSKSTSEEAGVPRSLGNSESVSTCALPTMEDESSQDTRSLLEDFSESSSPATNNNNKNNLPPALSNLRAALTLLLNTSDKSPILCEECLKKGLVGTLLTALADARLQSSELRDQQRLYLVKGFLGVLNNIACFYNDAREALREGGAVKVLQPYLKSQLLVIKTKTLMLLSYMITESENDVMNADRHLGPAIKMLEACLEKDNHYSKKYGFWAIEVAAGLNRLSSFESNKSRLVSRGVLPLYHQLMMRPCSEDEQLMAAQGLWGLAYNEGARATIQEDANILEALHTLQRSATREEIRRASTGALWVIEGRGSGVGAVPKSPRLPAGAGHLYISYHWTCKPFVVRLRDKLRSFGYKVFVDTDNMGTCGLPLDVVFEALEKTCVLVVCMTQRYKDSASCRNELEQAARLRRDLVPLRLQPRYSPDGWLAEAISAHITLDFSRDDALDTITPSLVRELGPRGRSKSALAAAAAAASVGLGDQRAASRSPSTQSVASAHSHGNVTMATTAPTDGNRGNAQVAAYWSEEEVTHWLMENGLTTAIDKFQPINGELLFEMKKMYQVAPESFYTMLKNELNFDWITQLRFTRALDQL